MAINIESIESIEEIGTEKKWELDKLKESYAIHNFLHFLQDTADKDRYSWNIEDLFAELSKYMRENWG